MCEHTLYEVDKFDKIKINFNNENVHILVMFINFSGFNNGLSISYIDLFIIRIITLSK